MIENVSTYEVDGEKVFTQEMYCVIQIVQYVTVS